MWTPVAIAQNNAIPMEAEEAAVVGSDFEMVTEGEVTYLTPSTDFAGATNPGTADKVLTFEVTFAAPGTYDLYIKLRVGPNGANDDSFYFGNGFGLKQVTTDADWVRVNNMSGTNMISLSNYPVSGGTITVPVEITNPFYGYRIYVTNEYVTSVPEEAHKNVFIYPNPASDYIRVSLSASASSRTQLFVYSATGDRVMNVINQNNNQVIDIHNLKPGLYILRLFDNRGVVTKKFIKR